MAAPLLCTYSAWIRRPSNRESVVCLRDALATGKPPQPPPLRNALRTAHDPFCIFRCAGANATATNCGTQCHSALLDVPAACRNTFGTLSAPWCDLQHISKPPSAALRWPARPSMDPAPITSPLWETMPAAIVVLLWKRAPFMWRQLLLCSLGHATSARSRQLHILLAFRRQAVSESPQHTIYLASSHNGNAAHTMGMRSPLDQ